MQTPADIVSEKFRPMSDLELLCQRCRNIDMSQVQSDAGFELHPSRKALKESAKTCPACAFIDKLCSERRDGTEGGDPSVVLDCDDHGLADVNIYHGQMLVGGLDIAAWPGISSYILSLEGSSRLMVRQDPQRMTRVSGKSQRAR